jgi:GTP-dependent dephospho-CoA kinase
VKLPEKFREDLKTPLGLLLPNNQVTKENVLKYTSSASFIITVGDATTEKMIEFGIIPSLQIIDSQEKRIKRTPPSASLVASNISCNNPPGEITLESIDLIKQSFTLKTPVRITIKGEEDLLVIPVCLYAPDNSVVMYGQPNEGLVIVTIDPEIRKKTQLILDSMN